MNFGLGSFLFKSSLFFLCIQPCFSAEFRAKLYSDAANSTQNPSILDWNLDEDTQTPLVRNKVLNEDPVHFVELQATVPKKDWSILFLNQKVPLQTDRKLKIKIPVESEETPFTLIAVNDLGEVKQIEGKILFPEWRYLTRPPQKKWSITPGLGITAITYQQTVSANFSELALTVKASAEYNFNSTWSLGAGTYFSALPFLLPSSGQYIRFLGANIRGGFQLPILGPPWELKILLGAFYTTSFSSSSKFGYQNIFGPQLYPALKMALPGDRAVWGYFKYAPLFDGGDFISWNNAEFAAGAGYSFPPFNNGTSLSVTLDISMLSLTYSFGRLQANTYSLGANYRF